jgi:hypothetical protein
VGKATAAALIVSGFDGMVVFGLLTLLLLVGR